MSTAKNTQTPATTLRAAPERRAEREVMNEKEAAEYLRVSPYTLRKWRIATPRKGPKVCRVEAHRIVYRKVDLDAYLAANQID